MPLLFPFHPHPLSVITNIFFFFYTFKPFIGWWGLGSSITSKKANHFTAISPRFWIQQPLLPLHYFNVAPNVAALGNIITTRIVPPTIVATPTTTPVLQLDQMK
jgi:hypothetical protein